MHTAFEVLAVDRVAILLLDAASGTFVPRLSRSRIGNLPAEAVPRSIVDTVVAGRVAVLSDNAVADSRFSGQSILRQSVRSAMCTPLMANAEQVLGILYVDSVTATNSFSDEDLQFLIAFGGIAAAGIRASMQADELQEQAIVRGSFERYFAPGVAAEIARNAGATRLGGERRKIAVLFSDVRGFTRMAEGMTPEALAKLLPTTSARWWRSCSSTAARSTSSSAMPSWRSGAPRRSRTMPPIAPCAPRSPCRRRWCT